MAQIGAEHSERDAIVEAAWDAYEKGQSSKDERGRRRPSPYAERRGLWEVLWSAHDFSWDGLADAAWERGKDAHPAQQRKQWRAPPDFPGGGALVGADADAFRQASLQDYWRWVPNPGWSSDQGWAGGRLADDEELRALGLLVEVDGALWHRMHRPEARASVALDKAGSRAELQSGDGDEAAQMGPEPEASGRDEALADAALAEALMQRLSLSAALRLSKRGSKNHRSILGADSRGQWQGVRAAGQDKIWRAYAPKGEVKRPLHVRAELGAFDACDARDLTFGGRADFSSATFGDGADFSSATFGDRAEFRSATFGDGADFSSATFGGKLSADGMVCKGRFQMRAAEVKGYAGFAGVTWPERFEDQHAAFEGCRFRDVADFKTAGFKAFGLFDGAEFKGRVLLQDPGDAAADHLFLAARRAAQAAVKADRQAHRAHAKAQREHEEAMRQWQASEADKPKDEQTKKPQPPRLDHPEERGADARFGALAGGLRTLKLAMVAQSDVDREQRFYRCELKARALRPSEPGAAKFAASVYGIAADYGASIGRPFIALAFVLTSFAAAYWLIGLGLGLVALPATSGPIYQALEFSLTNTFRPLSALTAEGFRENTLGKRLLEHSDFIALIVRLFSILQSLIALILAFLFGLAVRRRFQIA